MNDKELDKLETEHVCNAPSGVNNVVIEKATLYDLIKANRELNAPMRVDRRRNGVAILVIHDGKLLACQRIGCRDMNGLWQFPGGGIEEDESPVAAACRELEEETSLAMLQHQLNFLCMGVGSCQGNTFVTQFFTARHPYWTIKNKEPNKHSDWEWLTPDELRARPVISLIPMALDAYEDARV